MAPFDENSVMMYGSTASSKNGLPTIQAKDTLLTQLFGQRDGLSYYDLLTLNQAYQCTVHCTNTCHNGGYLRKDCSCTCPKGLSGSSCEDLDRNLAPVCGGIRRLQAGESVMVSSPNYPNTYPKPATCAWVFIAPNGTYLELEFTDINLAKSGRTCTDTVEVRYNLPGQKGPKFCSNPGRKLSTYRRMQPQMSVFFSSSASSSVGFQATVKAKLPSACASYPCQNQGQCQDNGHVTQFVCQCQSGYSGQLCELVEDAKVTIDFESGFEALNQASNDDYDWSLGTGATPTYGTGPMSARSGESYAFMEASRHIDHVARLSTTLMLSTRPRTVKLFYHMKGSTMGRLSVLQRFLDDTESTLWTVDGNQGDQWKQAEIRIPAGYHDYFVDIVGKIGSGGFSSDIAIDDLVLESDTSAAALVRTTTPAPPTTSGLQTIFANFEQTLDPLENTGEKSWTRRSGSTPSGSTGPSSAYERSYYAYYETSGGRTGDKAILQTPPLDFTTSLCLRFHYHMYGSGMGELRVETSDEQELWKLSGNQGNQWLEAEVDLSPRNERYRVSFVGTRAASYRGDMALDNIRITPGTCDGESQTSGGVETSAPVTGGTVYQGFESDFSGFDLSGNHKWIRKSGKTKSSRTGPNAAKSGNYFIYLEASSPMRTGQNCQLTSVQSFSGDICIQFSWNMYGVNQGKLEVGIVAENGDFSSQWAETGDKGPEWYQTELNITADGPVKVRFIGTRGSGYRSDMALDEITVKQGSC